MSLQPSVKEISYLQEVEAERFKLLMPLVSYKVWTEPSVSEQDNRWGHINSTDYENSLDSSNIEIHADYDWNKKIWEHENGVKILTNKISIFLSAKECLDLELVPKLGDSIFLMNQLHRVLSVHESGLILGTQFEYLHWELIIDTKQTIQE